MTEMTKTVPPDAGLIGELVTEIKVSNRTVGAYPKDHPAVQKSLHRVYTILQNIFHLRPGITLAVGKDTFVVGTHILDKKNHLYRQLAKHLRGLAVAYIHFSPGLPLDELYNFHHFISIQRKYLSYEEIREALCNFHLSHITIGFLDYEASSFEEGKTSKEIPQEDLWETYILGIINGTLRIEDLSDEIGDVPLDTFVHLLGILGKRGIEGPSAQKIVSLYVKKFLQRPFSNKEIKKFLAFIRGLPSNFREQFLSAVLATLFERYTCNIRGIHRA